MAILKHLKLGSILIAVAVASASLLVPASADAAKVGFFRMKRTWWGGTSTASPADPYISIQFHPRTKGPNKAPAPSVYVGSTTYNGRPAPRFTAPSKFIKDYTYHSACVPGTCFPNYPASSGWYSYWNLAGRWQPSNFKNGGAATTTTIRFPTVNGPPPVFTPNGYRELPLNLGNPKTPTTTPCVGGGLSGCGTWAFDVTRQVGTENGGTATVTAHQQGDPISFVAGNYDFSRAGSIMVTPGKNRFGGTMHFFYGPNHTYYQKITINTAYLSRAFGPQIDFRTPNANTVLGDVQYGGPFDIYRYTASGFVPITTGTTGNPGNLYTIRAPYFYTLAPFTTGMVTVWQPFGGTNTEFQLTGYDNRTPNGISGVISMVRPRMVHTYKILPDPNEPILHVWASGSAWQMDFHFLPEPGGTAMMASGLLVLAGLYRLRRR